MASPEGITSVESATDADELITGEAVALNLRPTGYVLRAAGAAIDLIAYFTLFVLLILALSSELARLFLDDAMAQAGIVVALVTCTVVVPTAVELLSHGRSLGKLAVGARIVRDDGGAIGFRHAFIRALTGVLEIFGTLGGLATLIALFDTRSRRLGDLIAGTYSQHERVSRYTPPVFGVPLELVEWSRTADVARLPDALARRIAQFLASAGGFTPESRAAVGRELAMEASRFVSPLPGGDPELFLAAVAAVRREREFAALQGQKRLIGTLSPTLDRLPRDFPDR